MSRTRLPALCTGLFLLLPLLGGCQRSQAPGEVGADVELNGAAYHISGPYSHANVAVFLLHAADQDDRDFLTLDEGLKADLVKVSEKDQERVNELLIENQSDKPLYLQEGERLRGGKQDRIIIASLVVPPGSGRMAVPTFCVEQSRWVEGANGRNFDATTNTALAPKGVRGAAKVEGSQNGVWTCVGVQKTNCKTIINCPNSNSSINETLDSPEALKISDEYASTLSEVLSQHADAVGVAVLVNGQIEEVNVYPNHELLAKFYPRLIQSYALQATLLKDAPQAAEPMAAEDVARFVSEGSEKNKEEKKLVAGNSLEVCQMESDKFRCTTHYEGKVVHWQMLKKNGAAADQQPRCGALGNNW